MDYVDLGSIDNAFTRGGNRLCFIDPRDDSRCIKVLRPDRSPAIRRREKGFPRNLRPLARFDENLDELRVWKTIDERIGELAYECISRCYGQVETNFGTGLVVELIRDRDGNIAKTLKQYLWEQGLTPPIRMAVSDFAGKWIASGMPSKKLLLHNMLLQHCAPDQWKIIVIDGLGWSSFKNVTNLTSTVARFRSKKKIENLWSTIDELLKKKQHGKDFGYHGWLNDDQRAENKNG